MEHVTIETMENGYYKITPDVDYVIRTKLSENAYSEVVTKDLDLYEVVKDGEQPASTPIPIIIQDPLEREKLKKIAEIEAYDKSDAVNTFWLGNTPMWLTVNERQQIATQISANEAAGRETMTRYFKGTSFTFPLNAWKLMLIALELYAGDALNVTEEHKINVLSLNNIDEVKSYDITTNYPEKLIF